MEERQSEDSPRKRSVPIPDALRKISGIVSLPKGQTEKDKRMFYMLSQKYDPT